MNAVYDPETGEIAGNPHALMEQVIAKGDLGKLTQQERNQYYLAVCDSLSLNALTKPFDYIVLNGRLVLYANKGCTEQLRLLRGVSVEDMSESERDGVFIVTVRVKDASGRYDMAKGAVMINGLKGDALANAIMKCETKAKRRATLSICGLGMLDESEIETIPGARIPQDITPPSAEPMEATQVRKAASRPRSTGNGALPPPAPQDAAALENMGAASMNEYRDARDAAADLREAVTTTLVNAADDPPTVDDTKAAWRTMADAIDAAGTEDAIDTILASKDWEKLHADIAACQSAAVAIKAMEQLSLRAEKRKNLLVEEEYVP